MDTSQKTIVLITGAFVSHNIWDHWKDFFENKGFLVIVPPWPYKNGSVDELRQNLPLNEEFKSLRLSDVISHFTKIVTSLPEKPIVVGHSLGGLIVQLLVNQGLVSAGVAIHSAPPKGIFSFEWAFLNSIRKPLGIPFGGKVYKMSQQTWNYAFANNLDSKTQIYGYNKYCIPESRQVLRDALSGIATIDFSKPHPPLLFITGTTDRIAPNSLNYENYFKYVKDNYITDYKVFENRNHYVLALPSWQEEAEYIVDWIKVLFPDE